MVRPRRCRLVRGEPTHTFFKPAGIPTRSLEYSILTVEEYEAIRLKDSEGIEQKEAAKKMGLSQPTFQRLLTEARRKIAQAIVKGKAIKIEGGSYKIY